MEIFPVLPTENWQWSRVELRAMRRPISSWLWKRRKEVSPLIIDLSPMLTPAGKISSFSMHMILQVSSATRCYGEQGKDHRLGDRLLVSAGRSGLAVCALSAGAEAAGV